MISAPLASAKWYNPISWFSSKVDGGAGYINNKANPGKLVAPENPKDTSTQSLNQGKSVTVSAPAGSDVKVGKDGTVAVAASTNAPIQQVKGQDVPEVKITIIGETHNEQSLGSANLLATVISRGLSFAPLIYVGIGLVLFGIFTMTTWGVAFRIGNGSVTPSFLMLSGIGCIVGAATLDATPSWVYAGLFVAVVIYYVTHYVFHISLSQAVAAAEGAVGIPVTVTPTATSTTIVAQPVAPAPAPQASASPLGGGITAEHLTALTNALTATTATIAAVTNTKVPPTQ